MTDYRDLQRLKELPVPTPREEARAAAVEAAIEAFKLAGTMPLAPSQGNAHAARLKRASAFPEGSRSMRQRFPLALAASVAFLVVAVSLTLHHLKRPLNQTLPTASPSQPKPVAVLSPPSNGTRSDPQAAVAQSLADARATAQAIAQAELALAARERALKAGPSQSAPSAPQLIAAAQPPPPPASARSQPGMPRDRLSDRLAYSNTSGASGLVIAMGENPDAHGAQKAEEGRDRFERANINPVKSVAAEPVSTFSIDVDTASYSFVRRALAAGRLPPKDAVRVEELINYFAYVYPLPSERNTPFQPTITVLPAPWNPANKLVHIAIKGYDVAKTTRPRANLVFLIDTSGSMAPADRLPLLKNAFRMLLDTLQPEDTVGIVTYAGESSVALVPTKVSDKAKIAAAIERLQAGGSTAGAAGIVQAYQMAQAAFDKVAVNRVILATDGDFNVGITNQSELKGFIERKRQTGIFLSVLGVGHGNYNDALMQALAQNGNGVAAYIDTLSEAQKALVDEASSTLFPIAKDVKIQIEFNPARVSEYRLIGYETRLLRREDFNNDKVDAGDIGSGHAVTAIYEITPVGSPKLAGDLRYPQPSVVPASTTSDGKGGEYAFLKIRYKLPNEDTSRLIQLGVTEALEQRSVDLAPEEVRFSTAVAAFGQLLRAEPYMQGYGFDDVLALAGRTRGEDPFGYRAEFMSLVRLAKSARP